MKANVFTCTELVEATYANISANTHLNAFVNIRDKELALKEAEESQKRIEKSKFEKELPLLEFGHVERILNIHSSV